MSLDRQHAAAPPLPARAIAPALRLALSVLGVLLAAYGLTLFVAFQYLPAHLVSARVTQLFDLSSVMALVEAAPWCVTFTLAAWIGLAARVWSRGAGAALSAAALALWPLALVATTLWFDDRAGRQVLAAALMGLVAYRSWPLLVPSEGRDTWPTSPGLPRDLSPHLLAALVAALGFAYLLFGAWARHRAQWSSLIDLGLFYEQYDNAAGELLFSPTLGQSFLGEHFSPSLALLWPIMALSRSPVTLLVIQSAAIAGGAWLLFELAFDRLRSASLALALMVGYLLAPWVQAAAFYDFHMDMLEPPMLFGLALALQRGRARWVWISALLLWLTKEDTFLYTSTLGLYAALFLGRRRLGVALILTGLAQAALVLLVALPALRAPFDPAFFSTTGPREGYAFLSRYSHLGGSVGAMVAQVVGNPLATLDYLTTGPRLTNLLALLFAFGGLGLFAGWRLILLLPTLEMLLADPGPLSGFSFYYGAVAFMFAPLVAIEGAHALLHPPARRRWPRCLWGEGAAPSAPRLAFGLAVVVALLVGWHPSSRLSDHSRYKPATVTPHQVQAEALMARIPVGAKVSATGYLAVHLQPGRDVRMFPYGLDRADWILLDLQRPPWPRSLTQVRQTLLGLPRRGFALEVASGGLFLLKRGEGQGAAEERARIAAALSDAIVIEAELSEQTGYINRVTADERASNGAYRGVDLDDRRGPDYLLYGPYLRLPPGDYRATFKLRWRPQGLIDAPDERVAVTVDVAARHGRRVLAKRDLRVGELRAAGAVWRDERLDITVGSSDTDLELRVYYHDLGALDLDFVRLDRRQ